MLLGGMLGLIAGAQPWWKASGGGASVSFTGSQASGGLTWALAAVVLAGVLLALVLRARGRRVVAAVIALAGIGMAVAGALRQRPTSDGVRSRLAEVTLADTFALTVTAWPWAYALAGVLVTGGAILMLVRAGRWPVRTARFDRAATGARSDLADDPTGAWRALDAGHDPTVSELPVVGDDRPDAQRDQTPQSQMAAEPARVRLAGRDQLGDRLGASQAPHSAALTGDKIACPTLLLALALALHHLGDFLLARAARHIGGPLALGSRLLPGRALQLLAFCSIGNFLGIHSTLIPAYFAISFFNPYPGKLTVTLVSSPLPSKRNTVPWPYFACSMVEPGPSFFDFAGAVVLWASCCPGCTAGLGAAGFGAPPAKNCWIASTEL